MKMAKKAMITTNPDAEGRVYTILDEKQKLDLKPYSYLRDRVVNGEVVEEWVWTSTLDDRKKTLLT
jgi:hypothetical protein